MRRAQAPLKFVVIAVGTRMPSWVTDACREYAKRMPSGTALELIEIKAEPRTSGKTAAQLLAAEAARIRAALPRLFEERDGVFHPLWRRDGHGLLITWETSGLRSPGRS